MLPVVRNVKNWWLSVIGRRGSALLFFGLLDCFYSWSLLALPPEAKQTPSYIFVEKIAPVEVWAGVWGVVGLICFVSAFLPSRKDFIAFTAAIAVFSLWGLVYMAGDIAGAIYRGTVSAIIWFAFALFVFLISGWPEVRGGDEWTQESS